MADGYIGVQTPVTVDKKLDTEQLSVGANTVQRERVQIAGTGDVEIAAVKNAAPATSAYGQVVRSPDGGIVALGATDDAVVAAGAVGTLSAKLRRISTDLATLLGYTDGLEGLLTTIDGRVDGVEALLTAISGYVDGLETLLTSIDTRLTASAGIATGTQVATNSGVALASQACVEVCIQADPDNLVDVFIGGAASQPIQLAPCATATLSLSNVNLVYITAPSGSPRVNWLART